MKKISETELQLYPEERIVIRNSIDILTGKPVLLVTSEYDSNVVGGQIPSYSLLTQMITIEGFKFTPCQF